MKKRNPFAPTTYTLIDEITASPTEPLPEWSKLHQLTMIWQGLKQIETAPEPTRNDWRVVSDAINLMETFVKEMKICEDTNGLLQDATIAMTIAGQRHVDHGKPIRLPGRLINAVRGVLEDYAALLDVLPHRTVVQCHRITERRIRKIMAGRKFENDIELTAL